MLNNFGSKAASGLYQSIIAIFPPHETFIESHLGTGAVMKRKPPTENNIGIDVDPRAINQFNCSHPVELINDCAHRFLAKYKFCGNELVYCDPPYLKYTRRSRRNYRFEYTEKDHQALLILLRSLPCHVVLSGYPSALYDDMLHDWKTIELQVMSQGGPRTEKIWFNYTVDRLYWATYVGKNFTDRQRIKRKAHTWGKNYKALPRGERLAVMAAIMAAEVSTKSDSL